MVEDNKNRQKSLKGKILITAKLKLLTGLHIGGNSSFAPIGAVDSPFVRDVLTREPIIPGSSLKGKIRTLLAKSREESYIVKDIKNDDDIVKRLFGHSSSAGAHPARLQFFDLFLSRESLMIFKNIDTDTYIGEVKFENSIDRVSGVANPRQIERVPAGAEFNFKLIYNVEDEYELEEDMRTLADGFELLHTDYLGGHGSRGYGRVEISGFSLKCIGGLKKDISVYSRLFEGCRGL